MITKVTALHFSWFTLFHVIYFPSILPAHSGAHLTIPLNSKDLELLGDLPIALDLMKVSLHIVQGQSIELFISFVSMFGCSYFCFIRKASPKILKILRKT
jgi:hypothetical protein